MMICRRSFVICIRVPAEKIPEVGASALRVNVLLPFQTEQTIILTIKLTIVTRNT